MIVSRTLDQIATKAACHAQQVERLGDSTRIMELLENGQCLPVVAQRLVRLFHVQVPVADPIEAARVERRIIERLRQDERLAKPWFCLRVVASCPQKAQV